MENPFIIIDKRLERIELLLEQLLSQQGRSLTIAESKPMTSKELAKYLNLSVYTIYGLVHKRSLPYIKKGRLLYFEKDAINEWLKQGREMTKKELDEKADEYLLRNPL